MELTRHLAGRIEGSIAAIQSLPEQLDRITSICEVLSGALFDRRGSIYTAGNGGSAAQALHLAEELIGRYRADRPAYRAVCLNADPTAITCIANDFGYDHIFSRQCEALLKPEDVLIVLSTSGNSTNVVAALRTARAHGATTIGLLGKEGGDAAEFCDEMIIVDGGDSAHIQEAHLVIIHLLCEAIELSGVRTAERA